MCTYLPVQDIDCVCMEGDVLVSASLDGDIRVWSANPGSKRCLRTITRRYPPIQYLCRMCLVRMFSVGSIQRLNFS